VDVWSAFRKGVSSRSRVNDVSLLLILEEILRERNCVRPALELCGWRRYASESLYCGARNIAEGVYGITEAEEVKASRLRDVKPSRRSLERRRGSMVQRNLRHKVQGKGCIPGSLNMAPRG
jgi:hypothetical protein